MFYAGQSGAYAVRLDVDFGAGTVARLEAKRHVITKWSAQDYLDIIERYKEKPLI